VQNDGKFSGNRNLGFAQPASFRKPNAPGFERYPMTSRFLARDAFRLIFAGMRTILASSCAVRIILLQLQRLPRYSK
jgi:hypothetical protein